MLKKIIIFLVLELFFFITVLMLTKAELVFHVTDTTLLTEDNVKKVRKLQYDKNYEINHPMKYLINIESENGLQEATLIWPTRPLGKFLVLVPYQSQELRDQQRFRGQLVRCVYKCMVDGMYIEMFDFVNSLETRFPEFKGKYADLPSIIINAGAKPLGWEGYFHLTRNYWLVFGAFFVVGIGLLVWRLMKD